MIKTTRSILFSAHPRSGRCAQPSPRALATAALAVLLVAVSSAPEGRGAAFDQVTLAESRSLEAKLQTLNSRDSRPSASYPAMVITEREANAYLRVHSGEFLPAGVRSPSLRFQPEHAMGSADVDFDTLARSYPNPNDWGPKVLAAMFKGTQHVTVTAKVQSEGAGVRVQIENVVVGSMTVPNWLVDYVVQNVLQPRYHFDLSKPVPYPDHVTAIVLGSAQTTLLRGPKIGK